MHCRLKTIYLAFVFSVLLSIGSAQTNTTCGDDSVVGATVVGSNCYSCPRGCSDTQIEGSVCTCLGCNSPCIIDDASQGGPLDEVNGIDDDSYDNSKEDDFDDDSYDDSKENDFDDDSDDDSKGDDSDDDSDDDSKGDDSDDDSDDDSKGDDSDDDSDDDSKEDDSDDDSDDDATEDNSDDDSDDDSKEEEEDD